MSITFPNFPGAADAHPLSNDDIVAYVGVTTQTGTVRSVVQHSENRADLVGLNKPFGQEASGNTAAYEINAIMKQWGGELIGLGVDPAATPAQVNSAVDKLAGYQDNPTMFVLGRELAMYGSGNLGGTWAASGSTIASHLETVCEAVYARGVATFYAPSAADDTSTNRLAFRNDVRHERVTPAFNNLANIGAGAAALGAGLAAAAHFGRGTGINGFAVDGSGSALDHFWAPTNTDATSLASGDALVLVNAQGRIEVLSGDDGEFYYDPATNNERYWEVGRQVDYIKRALTHYGRTFLSRGDFTQEGLTAELQSHADSLAAHGNARFIVINPLPSTGVRRVFHLQIHPYFAIRNLVFQTEVVDTTIVL